MGHNRNGESVELEAEDAMQQNAPHGEQEVDFDKFIEPPMSRCGKVISSKSRNQLSPAKRRGMAEEHAGEEGLNFETYCGDGKRALDTKLAKSKSSNVGHSTVQRLLRHLKQSQIEQIQYQNNVKIKDKMSTRGNSQNMHGFFNRRNDDHDASQELLDKTMFSQTSKKNQQHEPPQGTQTRWSEVLGAKYRHIAETQKKLSFADEVSRKLREKLLSSKDDPKPPVGQYHPKFQIVQHSPKR